MEGTPGVGSVGRERKADGPGLQDSYQGGNPEANRADRELGLGSVQGGGGAAELWAQETPGTGSVASRAEEGVLDDPKPHHASQMYGP